MHSFGAQAPRQTSPSRVPALVPISLAGPRNLAWAAREKTYPSPEIPVRLALQRGVHRRVHHHHHRKRGAVAPHAHSNNWGTVVAAVDDAHNSDDDGGAR